MQSEKDRLETTQTDESKIKQDILAELDSFLLESKYSGEEATTELDKARITALKELDRLIKQDLSYGEILSRLKSRNQVKPVPRVEPVHSDFYSSIHVVDLRQEYEAKNTKKISLLRKFFSKNEKATIKLDQLPFESKVEEVINIVGPIVDDAQPSEIEELEIDNKLTENIAESPEIERKIDNSIEEVQVKADFRIVFKKTALLAAITLAVLMPVQGFIIAGKWQQDKDKLLNYGQNGFLAFKSGIIKASSNSYKEADIDFQTALSEFNEAESILVKYDEQLLNIGDRLPLIGNTLKSGENLLAISTSLSKAAKIINKNREESKDLTDYIIILNQQLDELLPLLEDTESRLDKIVALPDDVQSQIGSLKSELGPIITNLKNLKKVTLTLENLLGSTKEQRYLLLFQNNNELRAGGGFIGSYALLDVNKGKIVQMEIPKGGTYDLTAGQKKQWRSPQALAIVNLTFNIWDANWWPDFPTSARKISTMFASNSGSSVDGIIAINATVLQKLLAVTGPIDFPEYKATINSENVIDILQAEIEGKRNSANPKTIISDLAPKILEKIFSVSDKTEELFTLLAQILQTKDLQLFSTDENIDKQISELGWRGEIMETDRDYLWVVSTNIAGGKTDLAVNQLIDHQAQVQANGDIINTIKITRSNDGSIDNPFLGLEGTNVSYLRVFVPQGSQLISAEGFDVIPGHYFPNNKQFDIDPDLVKEEIKMIDSESKTEIFTNLNRTVFANWQTLKIGETKTVTISYKLPFSLDLGDQLTNDWKKIFLANNRYFDHYSLLVQSQSGVAQSIINSRVIFPDKTKIIWQAASAEMGAQILDNELSYNQLLDRDQYFGVVITGQ